MIHVLQDRIGIHHDLMARLALHVGNETDSAGILFQIRIVETLLFWIAERFVHGSFSLSGREQLTIERVIGYFGKWVGKCGLEYLIPLRTHEDGMRSIASSHGWIEAISA